MKQTTVVRINFPAGIISPGFLLEVLDIASVVRVSHVRLGARQQLLLEVPCKHLDEFTSLCGEKNIPFLTKKDSSENIVSSYAAAGIFITDSWLGEGVYKDVFDLFDYTPRLKVNISDSVQTFTPLFTGHINWVASPHMHFWYLYVRLPKTNTCFRWPELVYSNNLCSLSKKLEDLILDEGITDTLQLGRLVNATLDYIARPVEKDLSLPRFHLPYYEGFNLQGSHYWLGIYRRDELFPVDFLKEVCLICLQTKISELHATTWKSLIIKGIDKGQRQHWDYLLGKYRINVRHAANELNWIIEDNCEDGLILKRHIIRYFDKEDVRTYGLCFSVKTRTRSGIFGSVILRREEIRNPHRLKSIERYTILYTADFNPNSGDYILYRNNIEKEYLGPYLVSLCKQYYEVESTRSAWKPSAPHPLTTETPQEDKAVYQCPNCLSIYNEEAGEPDQLIPAGTPFEALPGTFTCPVCETSAGEFVAVQPSSLVGDPR
jgi:rubredoxin